MNDETRIEELLEEMRQITFRNSSTRDEIVSDEENIALSDLDKYFDIDIFFSRKPGMRRSIQLISSGSDDENCVKLSCMTALASLCDTMISNKQLNMTEKDIIDFMVMWLDMHNIKVFDGRKNS